MFDSYVDAQVAIIQSRRAIDMAMQTPEWKALGRGLTDKDVADFQSSLSVSRESAILVTITFLDPDPNAARAAVRAVIQSYETIYDDANAGDENRRSQILDDLKTNYMTQLKRLRDTMQQDFGPESVASTYKFKLQELNRTESDLRQTQMNIDTAQALAKSRNSSTQPSTIAIADSELSNGENDIATTMRLRETALAQEVSQLQTDLKDLGSKQMQIDALSAEAAAVQEQLNKIKLRIQQLTVENQIGGRISVISDGDTPLFPDNHPRIKTTLLGFLIASPLACCLALLTPKRNQRKIAPPST